MSSESDEVKHNFDQEQRASAGDDDADATDSSIVNTNGLRVLAVDDSVVCLKILVALLRQCKYNVTETTNPVEALYILRTRKHEFDMVITDLRMLEMDGLVLLQKISLEMDLPVVMLSADDKQENIMKAIRYGARDYLIKPPRMAQIQNVWQHVVRKRLFGPNCKDVNNNINNNTSSITKEEEEEETLSPLKVHKSSVGSRKIKRLRWTPELHNKFVDAIGKIGPGAVPMEILKVMDEPGLTRANVASHLQKFKNSKNVLGQAESAQQARNEYSNNVNYSAGRNGYQCMMMTQAIGINPFLQQKVSFQQNNQNSRIFPQGTNKHLPNKQHQHYYKLPMNPSANCPVPTMLNNAPLPPRNVMTTHPPVPRFDGLMFSTLGNNNMTNSYSSSQPFPCFQTAPALFPAPTTHPPAFAGNIPAVNADSKQNNILANGQNFAGLAPETESMYPQLDWIDTAPDFPDTQMETWSMNNNLVANPAHPNIPFETANLSNGNNATHEELPVEASFQPNNTNLSDEDDNNELNSMVNSFNFEAPSGL